MSKTGILSWAVASLGVCAAVSVAIWVTGSPWCLLGLVFIPSYEADDASA